MITKLELLKKIHSTIGGVGNTITKPSTSNLYDNSTINTPSSPYLCNMLLGPDFITCKTCPYFPLNSLSLTHISLCTYSLSNDYITYTKLNAWKNII